MTQQLSLGALDRPRGLTRAELMTAAEVAELLDVPVSYRSRVGPQGHAPAGQARRHVRFIRRHVEETIFGAETA